MAEAEAEADPVELPAPDSTHKMLAEMKAMMEGLTTQMVGVRGDFGNEDRSIYQAAVMGAMEEIFPLVTVKRKSTDPPWYNWKVRKRIAQKRGKITQMGEITEATGGSGR